MRTNTQQSNPENPKIRKIGVQTILAILALAMAFTFNACSSDDGNDDPSPGSSSSSGGTGGGSSSSTGAGDTSSSSGDSNVFNENSQVYDYSGDEYKGSGVIKMTFSGCDEKLDAGKVTNGIVNLQLPSNVPDECLTKLSYDERIQYDGDIPLGITVNPMNAKEAKALFTLEDSDGTKIGELVIREMFIGIYYHYVPQNVSITGTYNCTYVDNYRLCRDITYDVNAKIGWNKMYESGSGSVFPDDERTTYSTNDIDDIGGFSSWSLRKNVPVEPED